MLERPWAPTSIRDAPFEPMDPGPLGDHLRCYTRTSTEFTPQLTETCTTAIGHVFVAVQDADYAAYQADLARPGTITHSDIVATWLSLARLGPVCAVP